MSDHEKGNGGGSEGDEAAYRQMLRESWLDTIMERDKSILTISSGAIGLLMVFVSDAKIKTIFEVIDYISTLFFFLAATVTAIVIFKENQKYYEAILLKKPKNNEHTLKFLDKVLVGSFFLGIASASMFIGEKVALSYNENNQIEIMKNNSQKPSANNTFTKPATGITGLSAAGIGQLKPAERPATASVVGIGNLDPAGGSGGNSGGTGGNSNGSGSGAAGGATGQGENK